MDMESLRLFQHQGQLYAAVGCPGGRVRIIRPGGYNTGSGAHAIGSVVANSEDLGHGGCALAVMPTTTGADIYLGTFTQHPPLLNPNQPLGDADVLTGSVRKLLFTAATGSLTLAQSLVLSPTGTDRGGFGVVGLCLADLLPAVPGVELIVTTVAGDLFVYDVSTSPWTQLFRTWVPGSLGCYNSILVRDLDQDSIPELYVASSMGIYRFHP